MHVAFGVILAVHGIAHLVGFVVPWRLARLDEIPYATTLLAGRVDVGDAGIRAVGLLWLLTAIGYLVAGAAVAWLVPGWWTLAFGVTVASTLMCTAGLPQAKLGLGVDLLLLALLLADLVTGWIPTGS
jgi:hypothetical protein